MNTKQWYQRRVAITAGDFGRAATLGSGGYRSSGMAAPMLLAAVLFLTGVLAEFDDKTVRKVVCYRSRNSSKTIYDHKIYDLYGKTVLDYNMYRGHVVLLVNVATYSRSTHQYFGLNALQTEFKDFEVLGVPCNQFGGQEPGANGTEIQFAIWNVRPGGGFNPNFLLTQKIDVNGPNEDPMYTFLKSSCPPALESFAKKEQLQYDDLKSNDIRWNFEKFLIDRRGIPVIHYSEMFLPQHISKDIQNLLQKPPHFNWRTVI